MRLIDLDTVYESACAGCTRHGDAPGECYNDEPCERLIFAFTTAETVEAAPVVHGQWIVCGDGEYVPFMCSACGKTTSWYHAQTANYCPNCGAKMNKEVNADAQM